MATTTTSTSTTPATVFPRSHVGFDSITSQIERKLLKRGFQFNVIWDPIVKYIKDQHSAYLRKELTAQRDRYIQDTRIHCCLFFIQPSGHALKPIDIVVLKKLSDVVNVVPVIAKADSLTLEERQAFKERIKEEFTFHNLKMYPYDNDELDDEERAVNAQIKVCTSPIHVLNLPLMHKQDIIPFAVVGSERTIVVNGQQVRGRQNRWGVINVEDENHCEFVYLRNFLTRTHLQDLIETTSQIHYETFRAKQLLALKESSAAGGHSGGSRPISPSADRELSRNSQRMTMNGY
ncbi:hypothetical protein APSETT444_009903 [Aspergillus pseudonomiae]